MATPSGVICETMNVTLSQCQVRKQPVPSICIHFPPCRKVFTLCMPSNLFRRFSSLVSITSTGSPKPDLHRWNVILYARSMSKLNLRNSGVSNKSWHPKGSMSSIKWFSRWGSSVYSALSQFSSYRASRSRLKSFSNRLRFPFFMFYAVLHFFHFFEEQTRWEYIVCSLVNGFWSRIPVERSIKPIRNAKTICNRLQLFCTSHPSKPKFGTSLFTSHDLSPQKNLPNDWSIHESIHLL